MSLATVPEDGSIFGCQFCYDKRKSEKALTWLPKYGFSHDQVDDGEGLVLPYKRTAVLVADDNFDIVAISRRFHQVSEALPRKVLEFVTGKLLDCAQKS